MSYYSKIHLPFFFPATKSVPKLFANTSLLVCLFFFSVKSDGFCHVVCLRIQKVNTVGREKAAPIHFLFPLFAIQLDHCRLFCAKLNQLVKVNVHRMALKVKIKERKFMLKLGAPSGLLISDCLQRNTVLLEMKESHYFALLVRQKNKIK